MCKRLGSVRVRRSKYPLLLFLMVSETGNTVSETICIYLLLIYMFYSVICQKQTTGDSCQESIKYCCIVLSYGIVVSCCTVQRYIILYLLQWH